MRYTPHFVIDDPDEGTNSGPTGRMQVLGQLVDHCEKRMSPSVSLRVGEPTVVERIVRALEADGAPSSAALAKEIPCANSITP